MIYNIKECIFIITILKKHKIISTIVSIILVILITIGGYGFYLYHSITTASYQPRSKQQEKKVQKDLKDKKPFSLYVSGNENKTSSSESNQNNHNGDSFLSSIKIDPNKNTTTVTKMDGNKHNNSSKSNNNDDNKSNDQINNDSDQIKQAQQNIGIPADASYIDINGAKNIVNQSNGLTVTPTQNFDSNGQHFTAGKTVNLNGDQALAYAKGGSNNQHQLLSSFISKNGNIESYLSPSTVKEISSYAKTNLSPSEINQLYQNYRNALQNIQYK